MELAEIVRASQFSLPLAAAVAGLEADDEASVDFTLEDQVGDNWCWAAVAVSIFELRKVQSIPTQCQIAEKVVPECSDCHQLKCDIPGDVVKALALRGVDAEHKDGAPDFETIFSELQKDHVVICIVRKEPKVAGSMPHVVVVSSAVRSSQIVEVKDPARDRFYSLAWFFDPFSKLCIGHVLLT